MSSGFLYHFFKPFTKVSIGIYFRKLYFVGRERIPAKGPLIIACNHPNSFAEPVIMASFQPRTLHFLVRGDVFKNPIIAWILKQTNQIPIYRKRDGFNELKKNEATFEAVYEKLGQEEAIMIFSEGLCIMEKRLRPLQKGTARMALGALEKNPTLKDLTIIPAGITYTRGDVFRSEVLFNVGKPISAATYFDLYQSNPVEAVNQLTHDMESAIKSEIIHVNKPEHDRLFDEVMDVVNSAHPSSFWPIIDDDKQRFLREQKIAACLNNKACEEINFLQEKVSELKKKSRFAIHTLTRLKNINKPKAGTYLWLVWGWIIMIPGLIINFIPYIASVWAGSFFRKDIEFYTPVRMAVLMLVALLQNGILAGISIYHSIWWLFIWILTAPLSGWLTILYLEALKDVYYHYRLSVSGNIEELKKLSSHIIAAVNKVD